MEDKNGKILLAGPWVGEFGWELFGWQGYLRYLSQFYKEVHVISRPGNKVLYEDFSTNFYEFDPKSWRTSMYDCFDMKANPEELINSIQFDDFIDARKFNIGWNYNGITYEDTHGLFDKQIYFKYQKKNEVEKFDLLLHPRNKQTDSFRNWSESKWQDLSRELSNRYKIATIGNSESFLLENTTDLRGISLDSLIDYMCSSKMVVGPSSGPMHMASLCGTKHLVWSSEVNRMRYAKFWNPFQTEVIFFSSGNMDEMTGWDPDTNELIQIINETI